MKATEALLLAALLSVSGGALAEPDGAMLYEQQCLVCHQADGGGVPNMQPELWNSPRANGDPAAMIDFLLGGSASLAPEDRLYDNDMPGFDYLSDQELAALISYVRSHFDNQGGAVAPADVAARR